MGLRLFEGRRSAAGEGRFDVKSRTFEVVPGQSGPPARGLAQTGAAAPELRRQVSAGSIATGFAVRGRPCDFFAAQSPDSEGWYGRVTRG